VDREDELLKILGKLGRGKIEDVADSIIAFFRKPEWWEEEFDKQFVARGSLAVFEDFETRDAVKAFLRSLLTRTKQDAQEEMVKMVTALKGWDHCVHHAAWESTCVACRELSTHNHTCDAIVERLTRQEKP
jgi:hypothetical protein